MKAACSFLRVTRFYNFFRDATSGRAESRFAFPDLVAETSTSGFRVSGEARDSSEKRAEKRHEIAT